MGKFAVSNDRLGVPTLTQVDTEAKCRLGTIVAGYDSDSDTEGEFIYVKFNAATTEGQACIVDLHNNAILASNAHANSGKNVGFAVPVAAAANDYGFLQISGKAKAKSNAAVADSKVMLTAVAGTVDDAALAGGQIIGAEFATADGTPAAGFAYVNCNRMAIQTQIT